MTTLSHIHPVPRLAKRGLPDEGGDAAPFPQSLDALLGNVHAGLTASEPLYERFLSEHGYGFGVPVGIPLSDGTRKLLLSLSKLTRGSHAAQANLTGLGEEGVGDPRLHDRAEHRRSSGAIP